MLFNILPNIKLIKESASASMCSEVKHNTAFQITYSPNFRFKGMGIFFQRCVCKINYHREKKGNKGNQGSQKKRATVIRSVLKRPQSVTWTLLTRDRVSPLNVWLSLSFF